MTNSKSIDDNIFTFPTVH